MRKINTSLDLQVAIQSLELEKAAKLVLLKQELNTSYESLKPFNLLKRTCKELSSSTDFKNGVIGITTGLALGVLSKMVIVGGSHNPIKKLFGSLFQVGISAAVAKNPEAIKSLTEGILAFFKEKKTTEKENE